MSNTSQGPGWWMASDQKWYPPEAHPDATQRTGGADGYIISGGITTASRVLSWVTAGGALLFAAALVNEAWRFDQWWNANNSGAEEFDAYRDADDLAGAAGGLMFMVGIALFVLMIIWLTKARRTANRFGGTNTTWSPGWAIGAWFIPVANFVLVKLIFMEVERLSSADADPVPIGDRWKGGRLNADGWWWFFLAIAGVVIGIVGNSMTDVSDDGFLQFDSGQYIAGHIIGAAGMCIAAASLIIGASMLARLDSQLRRRPREV